MTDLAEFFKDIYSIDTANNPTAKFPTFEEVLGILEIADQRKEGFNSKYTCTNDNSIMKARNSLIYLIASILQKRLLNSEDNHIKLVRYLARTGQLRRTAFISLNYDILIDNALTDLYPKYHLDYAAEFANFAGDGDWHAPVKLKSVLLLKLHGSLNWLLCPACSKLWLTPKEKSVSTLIDWPIKCHTCKTELVPIIIPPTFFKTMSDFPFQQIWRTAENVLKEVRRLIFCGYSFPDADLNVKYMLKRAELARKHPLEVFVVNKIASKEEKAHYEQFFKNKVTFCNASFEDFTEHGFNALQILFKERKSLDEFEKDSRTKTIRKKPHEPKPLKSPVKNTGPTRIKPVTKPVVSALAAPKAPAQPAAPEASAIQGTPANPPSPAMPAQPAELKMFTSPVQEASTQPVTPGFKEGTEQTKEGIDQNATELLGVSMLEAARQYDPELDMARKMVRRWGKSRKPKPKWIGKSSIHKQVKLATPKEMLKYVKTVEPTLPNGMSDEAFLKYLKARVIKPNPL
jgi:hypothetical protein